MNYAQAVCDALDELDRTPFGDMGKALDKISDLAVKSAQQAVKLEARIGGAEMSEAKHSELPYTVEDGETVKIKDSNGDSILSMFHTHLRGRRKLGEVRATADLIVRAANCHDNLVAALTALELQALQSPDLNNPANEWGMEALALTRTVLATLESEQ